MTKVNTYDQTSSQELTSNSTTVLSSVEHRVEDITAEILQQKRQVAYSFIQIGKLLDEAKGHLKKKGKWTKWLETEVDISVRMAQRYIQLYEAFPDATSVSHLGMTKALSLLALPEAQRETFLNELHEVNGKRKSVGDMSVREIRAAIREQTTPLEKPVEDATESTGVTSESDTAFTEASKDSMNFKPLLNDSDTSDAKPKSEEQSEPEGLETLASDIEAANKQVASILEALESQAADVVHGKIADNLRSLHEKVQRCLSLADLNPND